MQLLHTANQPALQPERNIHHKNLHNTKHLTIKVNQPALSLPQQDFNIENDTKYCIASKTMTKYETSTTIGASIFSNKTFRIKAMKNRL